MITAVEQAHSANDQQNLEDWQNRILETLQNTFSPEEAHAGPRYCGWATLDLNILGHVVLNRESSSRVYTVQHLRWLAGKLLRCAREIEGSPSPKVSISAPPCVFVRVESGHDIDLAVYNAGDENEALQMAREFVETCAVAIED